MTASARSKMFDGLRKALTRRTLRTTRRLPRMETRMMTSMGRVTNTLWKEPILSWPAGPPGEIVITREALPTQTEILINSESNLDPKINYTA